MMNSTEIEDTKVAASIFVTRFAEQFTACADWRSETCKNCGWIGKSVSRIEKKPQYACDASECKRVWVEKKSPACPAFVPREKD